MNIIILAEIPTSSPCQSALCHARNRLLLSVAYRLCRAVPCLVSPVSSLPPWIEVFDGQEDRGKGVGREEQGRFS